MTVFQASVGVPVEIPVLLGSLTGLSLGTLDDVKISDGTLIVDVSTFESDYSATLTQVHSVLQPGVYVLSFIPQRAGQMYVKITEGASIYEFLVQTTLALPPLVVDPGLEADYTVTVAINAVAVPGASVRVYNAAGSVLVTQGTTDSLGQVTFPLEAGEYQVRVRKDGYDFSGINPTTITVLPSDNLAPILTELIPSSGASLDSLVVRGMYFSDTDSEILFGAEATEAADYVDSKREIALVQVPAGLTATAIPVRLRKPDPANIGSYLQSNVLTFTRTG